MTKQSDHDKSRFGQHTKSLAFIMLKPVGAHEPLRGEILKRITAVAKIELIRRHLVMRAEIIELYRLSAFYKTGEPKPYLLPMAAYFDGKEVELLIVSSERSPSELIKDVDNLIGSWNPVNAKAGQIRHIMVERGLRYDLSLDYDNLIHSSASPQAAYREMRIWFSEEEIADILRKCG